MGLRDPDAPSVRAYERLAGDAALAPLRLSVIAAPDEAAALAARLSALPELRTALWIGDFVPATRRRSSPSSTSPGPRSTSR